MFFIKDMFYVFTILMVALVAYRIDRHLVCFFEWLEDFSVFTTSILTRLDRIATLIRGLSNSFCNDYDFLSNKLFSSTIDAAKKEICDQVLKDFKTKDGRIRKNIAEELIKLSRERVKNSMKDKK